MVEKYYKREGRRFVQVEPPQMSTITTNNAGKYYQSDGTFVNERTEDSIGFCIISLNTGHVVMALKDCVNKYTHNEAIEEAKKYFNGKGEIPSTEEMLEAIISYKKELGLRYYLNYRAVRSGHSAHNTSVVLRCAAIHDSPTLARSYIGFGWTDYRGRLRPIVRVK